MPGERRPGRSRNLQRDIRERMKRTGESYTTAARHVEAARLEDAGYRSMMREAGLRPLRSFPGTLKPWRSRCDACSMIIEISLRGVRKGMTACPYCAGRSRRRDPERATAAMLAAGLIPQEPFPGEFTPWQCECLTCGIMIEPTLAHVHPGAAWLPELLPREGGPRIGRARDSLCAAPPWPERREDRHSHPVNRSP